MTTPFQRFDHEQGEYEVSMRRRYGFDNEDGRALELLPDLTIIGYWTRKEKCPTCESPIMSFLLSCPFYGNRFRLRCSEKHMDATLCDSPDMDEQGNPV